MTDMIEATRLVLDQRNLQQRTVVPGLLSAVGVAAGREQPVDFTPGIADLEAGQPAPAGITPDAPMMSLAAGGFFVLMPSLPADEVLGLVCDRASGEWRDSRLPGIADKVNGRRVKDLADVMLTPFAITAPPGAPDTWSGLTLGGPAGVGIEVALDGTVTITGQAIAPLTPTVITMTPGGDINMEVGTGNSVNIGGVEAQALALGQKVIDAVDAAWAAATPVPNDGGAGLKSTWLAVWNPIKSTILALKAKGE
jgi:hypothetical protein